MLDKIVAVILAGGKSSRMGSDKALLRLGNLRLIDHVAKIMTNSDIRKIVVSGKVEGHECVPDLVPNKGPVGGICSSLIYCYEKHFTKGIIIPVDMPLISSALVKLLIDSSENYAFTYFEKKPLPLAVKIDKSVADFCAKTNLNLSTGREMSVKSFLKNFAASEIEIPENLVKDLTNTNTQNEWIEAQNEYQNK